MANARFSNMEMKAGIFLTFCIGLFIALLFIYGKLNRQWRGQRELNVAFTSVGNLRPDALVHYNGLEIGRTREVRIVTVDEDILARLPTLSERHLENLPLTDEEREALRGVHAGDLDVAVRRKIVGRTMVLLSLQVLDERDTQCYRMDDDIRVTSRMLGETVVDIVSGNGARLPAGGNAVLLGASGDMYTHLAKSMLQVKDILGSMGEMAGGGQAGMAQRMGNFEHFTQRIDGLSAAMENKLNPVWDSFDRRLNDGGQRIRDAGKALTEMKPVLAEALVKADLSLADLRARYKEMSTESGRQIRNMRRRSLGELEALGDLVRPYKEIVPILVHESLEWTERVAGRVEMIDSWMTDSERYIKEGMASARQTFQGLIQTAERLEERMWYLAQYPWAVTKNFTREEGLYLDTQWRKALVTRHYKELRDELEALRKSIKLKDASDQARLSRVQQVVDELDRYFLPARAQPARPRVVDPKRGTK